VHPTRESLRRKIVLKLAKVLRSPRAGNANRWADLAQRGGSMKKCSICGEWVDSFNGVTQYDDSTHVFICDCCFLQSESGNELLANVTSAQPLRAVDGVVLLAQDGEMQMWSNNGVSIRFRPPRN